MKAMSPQIRLLSPDVVNKIAAGEVVENPASVVKELIENSLDAGATEIIVEIKSGGRQLIRITDNGCGMSDEDALLSLKRHATSKIRDIDDLNSLMTMGFRGEAIASIASISKFTLITRLEEVPIEKGTMIAMEGGKLIKHAPAARSRGTTIEVATLFYNVPVRKKFQKSPAYDSSEIYKVVSVMALGYPHVKFHFIRDGITLLQLKLFDAPFHDQLKDRIQTVLSDEFFESCLPVSRQEDDITIRGFVGNPSYTRYNRLGQYLFINRRAVFSPVISRAVREGFGTTIPPQRYPVFVLHWDMPRFDVDVNVHPQKKEVRLRDEETIVRMAREAVSRALQKKEAPKIISPKPFAVSNFFPREKKPFYPAPPASVREPEVKYLAQKELEHPEFAFDETLAQKPWPRVLASLPGFILAEHSEGGLIIVDQKRAHQRVLFEKLQMRKGSDASQILGVPIQLGVTRIEADAMREFLPLLQGMGFGIREFGKSGFVVDAIPQSFSNNDIPSMIKMILEDLRESPASNEVEALQNRRIAAIALRGAMSSSTRLGLSEAKELIRQLWNCESIDRCPLGNPIWKHYDEGKMRALIED